MSDAEIEAAIRDAETYAKQDNIRRQNWDDYLDAQKTLAQTDQLIAKNGKTMDKTQKKNIKTQANILRGYLRKKQDKLTDTDRQNIKEAAYKLKDMTVDDA